MNSSLPPTGKSVIATETAGMVASTACAVHCIAFPWLATISALGAIHPQLHVFLALLSLVFALPLFFHVRSGMLPGWVGLLASMGCLSLVAGLIFHALEVHLTVAGAVMLFVSHLINLSFHRRSRTTVKTQPCCQCSSNKS